MAASSSKEKNPMKAAKTVKAAKATAAVVEFGDDATGFDDELFWIQLELMESRMINACCNLGCSLLDGASQIRS